MNDGKVISIVLVRAVTCGLWSWRDWVWYLLSPIFLTLFYKALLWQGGIWYWLFLGLFKKFEQDIMIWYFKNVRCLRAWGIVFQISYYRKSVLFWLMIILQFLRHFYAFVIANMCWLSCASNECFLIIDSIKHWKSQCGKIQTQICHFYYVNIQLKCHKFA